MKVILSLGLTLVACICGSTGGHTRMFHIRSRSSPKTDAWSALKIFASGSSSLPGYGMNYSAQPGDHQMFTNVFVPQWAYHEFLNTGKWPDKTMFVVEERMSQSKGSINKTGQFQVDAMGFGAEVKDASLSDKWALLQLRR